MAPTVLFSNAGPAPRGPIGIDLDKSTGRLFWGTGNNGELWTGSADGSGTPSFVYRTISFEQHDAEVDEANSRVFFTDEDQGVLVGPTDGSGPVTLLYGYDTGNPEAGDPVTVAYDPASDQIYFGGPQNNSIFVGAADGSGLSALYTAFGVRDIAIDPVGGWIYWVDLDNIWKAAIDGSGTPTVLFSDMGGNLRAIEIDLGTGTLFLGEFGVPQDLPDVIWMANADGTGTPSVLYSGNFGGIRGLTLESSLTVCTLDLSLAYADNTLTMDFNLGTLEPANWNVWLTYQDDIDRILFVEFPVIDPPIPFHFSLPFFPEMGTVGVLTTLTAPDKGIVCSAFELVNTGVAEDALTLQVGKNRNTFQTQRKATEKSQKNYIMQLQKELERQIQEQILEDNLK